MEILTSNVCNNYYSNDYYLLIKAAFIAVLLLVKLLKKVHFYNIIKDDIMEDYMKKIIPIFILIIFVVISLLYGTKSNKTSSMIFDGPTNDNNILAVYIYGELASSFPTTNDYSATVECTSNGVAVNDIDGRVRWTGTKWEVSISNIENGNVSCNVYFGEKAYAVGDSISLTLTRSPIASKWGTSTDGYDPLTGNYLLSNTYTNSGQNLTFTNEITDWYIWDYYDDVLTLISEEPTTVELKLNYSRGFNNGLFFMDDILISLYGGDGPFVRSINMVDILSKIFEYKEEVTVNGTPVSLVDGDGRALTSIITENGSQLEGIIQTLFEPTYGSGLSYTSANKYIPRNLYDIAGSTNYITFSSITNLRNLEYQILAAPISNDTQRTSQLKPTKWSYSITNFTNLIDSDVLSMLGSTTDYWIASRDYSFTNANNASVNYAFKVWTNNTIVPRTVYVSNTTSGQTVLSAALRPIVEIDLTQFEIDNGVVSFIQD